MRLIDEIAHAHSQLAVFKTDFYFVAEHHSTRPRYKVVETGGLLGTVVAPKVTSYRFDYVVFVFGSTGWTEVVRIGQEHVDTAKQAAIVAHNILTESEA